MRDSSASAAQRPAINSHTGPGGMLRDAREGKRLSIRAVADALHLNAGVVEALEEERFEDLPPLIFVRGYFRAYAKLVELPEDRVMAAFDRLGLEEAERVPTPIGSSDRLHASLRSPALWLLVVVVVLGVALALWWVGASAPGSALSEQPDAEAPAETEQSPAAGEGEKSASPEVSPAAGEDAVASEPAAPADKDRAVAERTSAGDGDVAAGVTTLAATNEVPAPSAGDEAAEQSASEAPPPEADSPADAAPTTAPVARESTGATADAGGESTTEPEAIVLEVSGESWVDIRDATGSRLLYGLLSGPVRREIAGEPPYKLVIGDAANVRIIHDGQAIPLSQHTRGDVARFQWAPDS